MEVVQRDIVELMRTLVDLTRTTVEVLQRSEQRMIEAERRETATRTALQQGRRYESDVN